MSRLCLRSLPGAFVLAAALAQLVVSHELVFAGTLPLVSLSHGHGHPVTLLAHGGHVDVVLHHERETDVPGAALEPERSHDGDHVLHVTGAETSPKRSQESPPSAVALPRAWAPPLVRPAPALASRALAVAARSTPELLRSTVLRI